MTNNSATATARSGGVGFLGLLTLLLVAAKLFAGANISWLVCFLPVIVGFALFLVLIFIVILVAIFAD